MDDVEECTVDPSEHQVVCADQPVKRTRTHLRDDILKLPKEIRDILAGGTAGMVAKSVVAPIDRIKILYQISAARFHIYNVPGVALKIIKKEGLTALWKGNFATMIRVFPYSGIQFMVFDRVKRHFLREHEKHRIHRPPETAGSPVKKPKKWGLTPGESLTAGMIAGGVSVVCTYPLDLTRAQLAALQKQRHHRNKGFRQVLAENYIKRGFTGLFRGITPTILGILPYSGIAFALNEQGKRKIQLMRGRDVTNIERMQCGAISGLFAQSFTYPFEVTRRRMQTLGLVSSKNAAIEALGMNEGHPKDKPLSMLSTMRALYAEQGINGFFKGVSMNWLKGPVAFSISFTAFDIVQSFMETEAERIMRLPRRFSKG